MAECKRAHNTQYQVLSVLGVQVLVKAFESSGVLR